MSDLTTEEGVEAYLEQTPFAAGRVTKLAGGYSNFTYRITLREPYAAPSHDGFIKTLVMKYAEPYVGGRKDIPLSVERQTFEILAFTLVPELVGHSPMVALPKLISEDRTNRVILMSDSGPESRTLKAILQSGSLPENLARDIGSELGTFIARLHTATRNPIPGSPAHTAKTAFATNDEARKIVASLILGRVVSTVSEESSMLSPSLKLSSEVLEKLNMYSQKAQELVNNSTEVLNMGDFWTGNILLALDAAVSVTVIDWELARPGFAGMDLGQFLAELHLLRMFHPKSRTCVDTIIAAFTGAYRAIFLEDESSVDGGQRLVNTAYDAAARVGVHLIIFTPRIPWGGLERTREVVQEGVDYILHSMDQDETWLRRSIVGGLLA